MLLDVGLLRGDDDGRANSGSLERNSWRRRGMVTTKLLRRKVKLKSGLKPNWPGCQEPPVLELRHFVGWSLDNTRREGVGVAIRLPSY